MNIGTKIRALRESRGFSQGDVEKKSGLLRSYISRVEGGYTAPSLSTIEKFAKALGVEPYQLLFNGNGRPRKIHAPDLPQLSRSTSRFIRAYEGLSASNRRLLSSLVAKLAKN
jgi:transcriptional regulator with XRE-family HTH domain